MSITYSPNGRHIISGSHDNTIRMWDAETGSAVGKLSDRHTDQVQTVAYSPDGSRVISGSTDGTIHIWDAKNCLVASDPHEEHSYGLQSATHSPNDSNVPSVSTDQSNPSSGLVPIRTSPIGNQISPDLCGRPDPEGWVRDPKGGLLYWVPRDYRGVGSSALLTIPPTSNFRPVSLDFTEFVYGTSWTDVYNPPQS